MTNERDTELPPLPKGENWQIVDFSRVTETWLHPFQIIPVPSIREFDMVEAGICHSIKTVRDYRGPEYTILRESRIAGDRISNHLRPRGFGGSLVRGQAVLLPFNKEYGLKWAPSRARPHVSDVRPDEGLNVLYMGELKASRVGMLGQVCLEAAYYQLPNRSRYVAEDHLRRLLGPMERTDDTELNIEEMLQQNAEASRRRAEKLTATALRHAYSAGAFGLGKRK